MKDGFITVGAANINVAVANVSKNKDEIILAVREAADSGVRLLCLPELCISGYTCADLFGLDALVNESEKALFDIVERTRDLDIVFAVGLPVRHVSKLYNCAAVVGSGHIIGLVPKTYLPDYREFYEPRQFESGKEMIGRTHRFTDGTEVPFTVSPVFTSDILPGYTFTVEICEDLWVPEPPSVKACLDGAAIVLNLSASNEIISKAEYRRELVRMRSAQSVCAYIYSNSADSESTQDLIYSGHSLISQNGSVFAEMEPFAGPGLISAVVDVQRLMHDRQRATSYPAPSADAQVINFTHGLHDTVLTGHIDRDPFVPSDRDRVTERCRMILLMQAYGLKKRLEHTHAKKLVLGLSGGLDSTLALIVCTRAMKLCGRPMSDIITVSMPCFGTTKRTKNNAQTLAGSFGTDFREINIGRAVLQHFSDIGLDKDDRSVTYENCQARERTQVLMDLAGLEGGFVVGTGDLSELALGWCTYNADHMSMYGVNASVPKTLVRYIVGYAADSAEKDGDTDLASVLRDILATPVSPELLPPSDNGEISQKTEDIIGPYELHDFFLYYTVRFGFPAAKILRLALYAFDGVYDRQTIEHWLDTFYRRFFSQQFKRSCMPDGVKIGSAALSPRGDWRMPSDAQADIFRLCTD